MMKKLLLLSSALLAFHLGTKAQSGVSTPTVVTDTLNYFINKQKFKVGSSMTSTFSAFPYFLAPTGNATNSHTYVTHVGSIFKNSDTNLIVKGLEGWCSKHNKTISGIIPIELYLCNVVNGLPVMPPIDSIAGQVGNNCDQTTLYCPPQLVAGNFTATIPTTTITGRRVKGDFAVLIRNYSKVSGDTVRMFRTSTFTPDNLQSFPGAQFLKTGENKGVLRKSGAFSLTTHYTNPVVQGFGYGTDYEFCVAPRVQFTLTVKQNVPAPSTQATSFAADACAGEQTDYTNASSPEFTNRQFNLNEFYRQLQPFQFQPSGLGFAPDSVVRWDFGDDLRLDTMPNRWGRVQDLFLAPNQNVVSKWFDTAGVFTGTQTAKYRKMTTTYHNRITGIQTFTTNVSYCNSAVGIRELGNLAQVSVYPNPSVNGKVSISGLNGKNTITVYNMIGQAVLSESSDKETAMVDLIKQPAGAYMIRITTSDNRSRTVKVIHN